MYIYIRNNRFICLLCVIQIYINIFKKFLFYLYKIYKFYFFIESSMHRRFNLFSDVFSRTIFIRFFMFGEMDMTFSDFSFKS